MPRRRQLIDLPGQITLASAAEDVRSWAAQGYRLVSILDEDYPARLRGIHLAPPVIFMLGTVLADDPAVSAVGSRESSAQGLAMAAKVARELTVRKMTVVSGLARGIDTAALQATLDAGGLSGHRSVVDAVVVATAASSPEQARVLSSDESHLSALAKAAARRRGLPVEFRKI